MIREAVIICGHALAIWGLCGATMAVGRSLWSLPTTLIVHALVAPAAAAFVSIFYFRRKRHSRPLVVALAFVLIAAGLDAGLIAPVFEKSYAMFRSPLGVWLPLASIFAATFVVGTLRGAYEKGR